MDIKTNNMPLDVKKMVKDFRIQRVLEATTRQQYEDTKHLRINMYASMKRHIKNNTFGNASLSPQEEHMLRTHARR